MGHHFIPYVTYVSEREWKGCVYRARGRTRTPLKTVYIGCPKQVLVLAGPGDHGDCENIFFMKILPVL